MTVYIAFICFPPKFFRFPALPAFLPSPPVCGPFLPESGPHTRAPGVAQLHPRGGDKGEGMVGPFMLLATKGKAMSCQLSAMEPSGTFASVHTAVFQSTHYPLPTARCNRITNRYSVYSHSLEPMGFVFQCPTVVTPHSPELLCKGKVISGQPPSHRA